MRTDLAATTLDVTDTFYWNIVALDSEYKQVDFVEFITAPAEPSSTGTNTPAAATDDTKFVLSVDTNDDAADPLLVG